MKKVELLTKFQGKEERTFIGYEFTARWKPVSYYGQPKRVGEYYVINADGNLDKMKFDNGMELFAGYIRHSYDLEFEDGDVTDSKLIELAKSYYVWHQTMDNYSYGEWSGITVTICKTPKYWLDINLEKESFPVPNELEDYDVTETDDLDY